MRIVVEIVGPDGRVCPPHAGQRALLESSARVKVAAWGRQAGKTTAAALYAVRSGLQRRRRIWIVGPTYRLTDELWRRMTDLLRRIDERYRILRRQTQMEIELVNGTLYEKRSAHEPHRLRGGTLDLLIIDEAAFVSEEAWYTVQPATVVRRAEILLISSPFGRNWFYHEWLKGQSGDPMYASWRFPSTVNPYFTEDDLERARAEWPEIYFRREYLAEFADSGLEVFPKRVIEQCTCGDALGPPEPGRWYVAGIDLAKYQDWTVVCVMDDRGHVRALERFQQLDWGVQKARIAEIVRAYRATAWIDSTGVGDPIYDDLRRAGLHVKGYAFTADSKRRLVENLIVAMERRHICFPPVEVLLKELEEFQRRTTKVGRVEYSHPAGRHDDCVMALALATWGLSNYLPMEAATGGRRVAT